MSETNQWFLQSIPEIINFNNINWDLDRRSSKVSHPAEAMRYLLDYIEINQESQDVINIFITRNVDIRTYELKSYY